MKKIFALAITIILAINNFAQDTNAMATKKEYYLQKAKNQKTTGFVLLGVGTVSAAVGFILFANNYDSNTSTTDMGGFMLLGGIVCDLASIPFFISSGSNNRKAAEIALGAQQIYLPQNITVVMKYAPAVTIKIGL